jgi:hypothetical protein
MEKRAATVLPTVTWFATWLAIGALRKSDVPVAPLLQRAGLSVYDFEDRHSRISAAAQAKSLEDAARAMDDSAFALQLAAKANPREGGLPFYVASAATAGPIRRPVWRGHRAPDEKGSWPCHPCRKDGASCGNQNDEEARTASKLMKNRSKSFCSWLCFLVEFFERGAAAGRWAQK